MSCLFHYIHYFLKNQNVEWISYFQSNHYFFSWTGSKSCTNSLFDSWWCWLSVCQKGILMASKKKKTSSFSYWQNIYWAGTGKKVPPMKMKLGQYFMNKGYYFQKVRLDNDTELIICNRQYDSKFQFLWTDMAENNTWCKSQLIQSMYSWLNYLLLFYTRVPDTLYLTPCTLCPLRIYWNWK